MPRAGGDTPTGLTKFRHEKLTAKHLTLYQNPVLLISKTGYKYESTLRLMTLRLQTRNWQAHIHVGCVIWKGFVTSTPSITVGLFAHREGHTIFLFMMGTKCKTKCIGIDMQMDIGQMNYRVEGAHADTCYFGLDGK